MLKLERQNFLLLLIDYINDVSSVDFFSQDKIEKKFPFEFIDLPEIILKIMWIKEILEKV